MRKPHDAQLIKALATEIKARRTALSISQEELAHRADLNRTFIGKLELGQTQPSLTVLFALAKALETNAALLVSCISLRETKELNIAMNKAKEI